ADAVAKVPGVASLTQLHGLQVLFDGKRTQEGTAVDGPLAPVFRTDVVTGTAQPTPGSIVVSQKTSERAGWGMSSTHTMSTRNGTVLTTKVTGIYRNNQLLGPWL